MDANSVDGESTKESSGKRQAILAESNRYDASEVREGFDRGASILSILNTP